MDRVKLAVTVGDPRGIGPEIISAALSNDEVRECCTLVIVGPDGLDPSYKIPIDVAIGEWPSGSVLDSPDVVGARTAADAFNGKGAAIDGVAGKGVTIDGVAGKLAGLAIERAVAMAMAGEVDGIVTAPIDKSALFLGGYNYPGHTEMLGALTGSHVSMMLASDRLRVVLATTHIPLRDVPTALTEELLRESIATTRSGLQKYFGIDNPKIALCGLNPHLGDGGRFGSEDTDLLAKVAEREGAFGPYPADTVFVRAIKGEFDAVIAPYHDVGMTAIKVASFGSGVNITLGLPFPRTSPDHGTALDIAGKGLADPSSFIHAVLECSRIVRRMRATR